MKTLVTTPTAQELFAAVLSEKSSDAQRSSVFDELMLRPVTAELLTEGVRALREEMIPVELAAEAIDTCGTGGSGLKTFNTSTLTAFIVAAAGGKVAKHGNRSASGNCGSFDLLEELRVKIDLTPEQERRLFDELGIAFLFAPLHHPALKQTAPLRKQYGKKTVFNLMGPLCNPAHVRRQMIGAGHDPDANIIARALHLLGSVDSFVVTGRDGLDEVTTTTATTVRRVSPAGVSVQEFIPGAVCVPLSDMKEISGGTPHENATLFLQLARGDGSESLRNLAVVNAAHALLLTPLTKNLRDAYAIASKTLASGKVFALFRDYRDLTRTL